MEFFSSRISPFHSFLSVSSGIIISTLSTSTPFRISLNLSAVFSGSLSVSLTMRHTELDFAWIRCGSFTSFRTKWIYKIRYKDTNLWAFSLFFKNPLKIQYQSSVKRNLNSTRLSNRGLYRDQKPEIGESIITAIFQFKISVPPIFQFRFSLNF